MLVGSKYFPLVGFQHQVQHVQSFNIIQLDSFQGQDPDSLHAAQPPEGQQPAGEVAVFLPEVSDPMEHSEV